MKTTENFLNAEQQFDVLLRHALLEKENMFRAKTIDHLASFAFTSTTPDTLPDNPEVLKKLQSAFGRRSFRFGLNSFLLLLLTGTLIATVFFFSVHKHEKVVQKISLQEEKKASGKTLLEPLPSIRIQEIQAYPMPQMNPVLLALIDSASQPEENRTAENAPSSFPGDFTSMHIPEEVQYAYEEIPVLTEDQKKQTAKDKLKIMREVGKKRIYTNLPSGATNVNGVLTQLSPFGIKDAEITNLEYRTFLHDLLVQGRFEDYLLAKPVAGGWKALGIAEFENMYSENEAYNNFPACNITRKGAELYCAWMSSSMKAAIRNKDVKWNNAKMPAFRLPSNAEWIYAARACDTTIQTPWENYSKGVQNTIGCYLCNFNYSASKNKLPAEGPPMSKNGNKGCISPRMSTKAVITTAGRAIDTLLTAPVYSYNPNNQFLYCTLGNVSEMVWTYDAANPSVQGLARAMGGSWYSDVDNVLIEAPEQYAGVTEARAYIGFRIVMILE